MRETEEVREKRTMKTFYNARKKDIRNEMRETEKVREKRAIKRFYNARKIIRYQK